MIKRKNKTISLIFLGLFLISVIGFVYAQEEKSNFNEKSNIDLGDDKKVVSSNDKISLDLKNIEIIEFLRILSLKTGKTIVPTKDVTGRISLFLNNVSFQEVLDILILSQNLACEKKGAIIYIMSNREYKALYGKEYTEFRRMATIKLNYAKPANIFNAISQLKSDIGKIVVDEATGTVIIIDIPEKVALIQKMVKKLDLSLNTQVYDLNYIKPADAKIQLTAAITPGTGEVIIDERSGKAIVSDLPDKMHKITKLVGEIDEETRQVFIEGEIIQVTISDEFNRGIDWEKVFTEAKLHGLDLVGTFPASPVLSAFQKVSVGTLATDHYKAMVSFLSTYGKLETLSQPRIAIVNNEESNIMVGTRDAYVTQTLSQGDTSTVTSEQVEFIDVGVKLKVVPSINSDGYITMKIKPEVSSISETITTSLGSRIPIVQTAETETVIKVKDGTMIMLGGLLEKYDTDNSAGIPKLGRLPWIGALFGRRDKLIKRKELVIFITPHLISGSVSQKGVNRDKYISSDFLLNDKTEAEMIAEKKLKEEAEAKRKAQVRERLEKEARAKADEKAKIEAEGRFKAEEKAKFEAQERAKAEVIAKEAALARQKAESDVEIKLQEKAELERKVKWETQERIKQEEKLRLETEARLQAEEKAKTEIDARLKAEFKAQEEKFSREETDKKIKYEMEYKTRLAESMAKSEVEARVKAEEKAKLEVQERLIAEALAKKEIVTRKKIEEESQAKLREKIELENKAKLALQERIKLEEKIIKSREVVNQDQEDSKIQLAQAKLEEKKEKLKSGPEKPESLVPNIQSKAKAELEARTKEKNIELKNKALDIVETKQKEEEKLKIKLSAAEIAKLEKTAKLEEKKKAQEKKNAETKQKLLENDKQKSVEKAKAEAAAKARAQEKAKQEQLLRKQKETPKKPIKDVNLKLVDKELDKLQSKIVVEQPKPTVKKENLKLPEVMPQDNVTVKQEIEYNLDKINYQSKSGIKSDEIKRNYAKALSKQDLGKLEEAKKLYEKIIDLDSFYAPAYNQLGIIYETKNKVYDALMMYLKAIEVDSDYAPTYTNMALLKETQGDYAGAIKYWNKRALIGKDSDYWVKFAYKSIERLNEKVNQIKINANKIW